MKFNLHHQCIEFERKKRPLFPYIVKRVHGVFKATPKIRRSSSVPLQPHILFDTYIEKADVQISLHLMYRIDYDESKDDFNINANEIKLNTLQTNKVRRKFSIFFSS